MTLRPVRVEPSTRWLDQIVTAQQALADANNHLNRLSKLYRKYTDLDGYGYVQNDAVEAVLGRDGTYYRIEALRSHLAEIAADLGLAQRCCYEVNDLVLELKDMARVITETDEAMRVLIDDALATPEEMYSE